MALSAISKQQQFCNNEKLNNKFYSARMKIDFLPSLTNRISQQAAITPEVRCLQYTWSGAKTFIKTLQG